MPGYLHTVQRQLDSLRGKGSSLYSVSLSQLGRGELAQAPSLLMACVMPGQKTLGLAANMYRSLCRIMLDQRSANSSRSLANRVHAGQDLCLELHAFRKPLQSRFTPTRPGGCATLAHCVTFRYMRRAASVALRPNSEENWQKKKNFTSFPANKTAELRANTAYPSHVHVSKITSVMSIGLSLLGGEG